MQMQRALGSDIVMIFDECTPYPATYEEARISMELSLRWARRSHDAHGDSPGALFGIVQGGMYDDLRDRSLEAWWKWILMGTPLAVCPSASLRTRCSRS